MVDGTDMLHTLLFPAGRDRGRGAWGHGGPHASPSLATDPAASGAAGPTLDFAAREVPTFGT